MTITIIPPAPREATRLGHEPTWDPPYLSGAERWTCDCGHTVLRYGRNVYGSATEQPCPMAENEITRAEARATHHDPGGHA